MTESILAPLQQWLLFSGIAAAVGCIAWRGFVAPRAARATGAAGAPALREVEKRVATVGAATSLLLIGVWILKMVVQVMGFRDPFVPLSEDINFLVLETFWGTVWMAQGAILPLLAGAFLIARRGREGRQVVGAVSPQIEAAPLAASPAWWLAGALVLFLVATLALSSHAMGVESGRPLIVAADGMHALAAGGWIGSLGLILAVGRPGGAPRMSHPLFVAQLRSFSALAIASVFTLVSMGLVLSWTHLHSPSDLWTTTYGRVLSAKVGAAGVVMLLGFLNWRRGLPGSDSADGEDVMRRRAALEVTVAMGVLLLTAILTHTAKP
ncbi:MAG: CopD family protein [Gemmatimonadota bacterium]